MKKLERKESKKRKALALAKMMKINEMDNLKLSEESLKKSDSEKIKELVNKNLYKLMRDN